MQDRVLEEQRHPGLRRDHPSDVEQAGLPARETLVEVDDQREQAPLHLAAEERSVVVRREALPRRVAVAPEPLVRADLREKRLDWVLPNAAITEPGLFAYFPRRSVQPPNLRAFLDAAKDVLHSTG